jgi:transcription antitermination factor NusA-like protein
VNSIYPAPVFDPGLLASSHSLIVAAFLPESELSPSDLILLNSLKRKSLTSSPPVNLTRTRKRSSTGLLASSLLFAQVIGVGSDRRVISEKGLGGDYLVVSRKGSDFVKNLLALKIPTIASGELEIKNLVREPGYRTIVGVAPPVASGAALVELKAEELAAQCSTVWAAVVAEAGLGLWKERVEIVGWNIYQPERMFSQLFASIGVEFNSLELDHSRRQIRVGLTNTSSQEKDIGKLVGKGGLNLRLIKAFSGWSVVF